MRRLLLVAVLLAGGCRNVAQLQLNTDPDGAQVWFDQDSTGLLTDCLIPDVYSGVHYLELRLDPFGWGEVLTLGRGETRTIDVDFPEVEWSASVARARNAMAVGHDGTVYSAQFDGAVVLSAFDPTGGLEWSSNHQTGYGLAGMAVGDNGSVYLLGNEKLVAVGADGIVDWEYDPSSWPSYVTGPAIGDDGTIYFGLDQGLYAVTDSGRHRWSVSAGAGYVGSAPAIGADGTIYVWTLQDRLLAFNREGTGLWSYQAPAYYGAPGGLAIGPDGTIYVVSQCVVLAVNPDGTGKWQAGHERWTISGLPAVGTDGAVYVQVGETLYVYAAADGHLVRSQPVKLTCSAPVPALGRDGSCFISGYGLDALAPDGVELWWLQHDRYSSYAWSEVLLTDSLLYTAGDGRVFAVKTGTGPAASSWPMYRHDPQRTGRAR